MTNAEFEKYYPIYENDIKAIARKLARRDNDLFDDLCSVGSITLWGLEIKKAETNEAAWVKSAVRKRMIDFLRKERNYTKVSLDRQLLYGNQVVENEAGEAALLHPLLNHRADAFDDFAELPGDESSLQYPGEAD